MSLSNSLLSYTDCKTFLDAALDDELGARLDFTSSGAGQYFISRLHQFRVLDRKFNAEVHPPGSHFHNRSIYDALVCRLKQGQGNTWWVYVEHSAMRIEGFQKLSEVADEALAVTREPPRLLLAPPQAQGIKRRV